MKRILLSALWVMVIAGVPLGAQSIDYEGLASLYDEPVTAGATGKPQRLSDVPVSMEIITRQEILASGARDIPELLRRYTGVEVARTFQSHADLSIRGYNQLLSNRTLVLINGHQVYLDVYGTVFWHSFAIELQDLEQIELVRGPASSLYGFNAELGVINLITRTPHKIKETRLTAEIQEPTGSRLALSTPFRLNDRFAVRLSAGREEAEGFDNADAAGGGVPTEDSLERTAFSAEAHWLADAATDLHFHFGYNDNAFDVLGPGASRGKQATEQFFFDLNLSNDTQVGLLQLDLQAYNSEVNFDTFRFGGTQNVPPLKSEFRRAALANLFSVSPRDVLRLEGEFRRSAVAFTAPTDRYQRELAIQTLSFSAMWHVQINTRTAWNTSARFDHWDSTRGTEINALDPIVPVNDAPEPGGEEYSYSTALNWKIDTHSNLRFSFSHGHHIPSLIELSQDFRFAQNEAYGNPFLKPEGLSQLEISYTRTFGANRHQLRVNAYVGEGENIIEPAVFLPFPGQNTLADFTFVNSADTEHYGVEGELLWHFTDPKIDIRLNTTWFDLEDTPIEPYVAFNRLEDNQINHRANLTLDYHLKQGLLQGEFYWVDGYAFSATSLNVPPVLQGEQDAYTVMNLHGSHAFGPHWRLRLSGYNLLEEHREVPTLTFFNGFRTGGIELERAYRLTCTYTF